MTENSPGDQLRITLKDVYKSQQSIESKLAETFSELKITLAKIQAHLDNVSQRNRAADVLHAEQGRRIAELERTVDVSGLRTLRQDRDVLDTRVRKLEDSEVSGVAVAAASATAGVARHRARGAMWGMVAALATALGTLSGLIAILLTRR